MDEGIRATRSGCEQVVDGLERERLEQIKSLLDSEGSKWLLSPDDARWMAVRLEELAKEKEQAVRNLSEIRRILEEVPYREYTSNKIRFQLLELAGGTIHD